jgi:hypothetical protein
MHVCTLRIFLPVDWRSHTFMLMAADSSRWLLASVVQVAAVCHVKKMTAQEDKRDADVRDDDESESQRTPPTQQLLAQHSPDDDDNTPPPDEVEVLGGKKLATCRSDNGRFQSTWAS